MRTNKRAIGVIVKDGKILIFRRFKNGESYYSFPGGGIEEGETKEEAAVREMKEELCLEVKINKLLFKQYVKRSPNDESREYYFFLITEFSGEPKLGGPEKERMNENNQYYPEWHEIGEASKLKNLYPQEAAKKIFKILESI